MSGIKRLSKFRYSDQVFFIISALLMSLGFYGNVFHVAEENHFHYFQKDMEGYVIGRLSVAERQGIFYGGGLTGIFRDTPDENNVYYQYDIYVKKLDVKNFRFYTYYSQTGGQAILFALFDKLFDLNNLLNLRIFWALTSLMTAIAFSFFLLWVKQNFGKFASIVVLILILISSWITVFGNNLWWVIWAFYIPFMVLLYIFSFESKKKIAFRFGLKQLFFLSFFTVLAKCFFTGFEFITTTLLMSLTPMAFYAYYDKWKPKVFFSRIITFSAGAIFAILVSMITLIFQISSITGKLSTGVDHIIYSFLKRSSGAASPQFVDLVNTSISSSLSDVLSKYWNGPAIDLNFIFHSDWPSFWLIDFGELIVIFMIFSVFTLVSKNVSPTTFQNRRQNAALVLTTWTSILAPLSWFIIFKGHSYIHTHMNFIVWYMPFAIFGFAIVGSVLASVSVDIYNYSVYRIKGTFVKTTSSSSPK